MGYGVNESPQGKLVLCHRLPPHISESAGRAWWRDVFGPAVHDWRAALRFIRYEQLHCEGAAHPLSVVVTLSRSQTVASLISLVTPDPDDAPVPDMDHELVAEERWDVLDELWWTSPDQMLAALSSPDGQQALRELRELFETRSDARAAVVTAEHVIAEARPETSESARIAFCLRGRPDATTAEMQEYWRDNHGQLVQDLAPRLDFDRYDQAHAITDDPRVVDIIDLLGATQERPYVGLASLSYASMTDLSMQFAKPSTQVANLALMKDELAFIDPPACPAVLGVRVPVEPPSDASTGGPDGDAGEPVPEHPPLFGVRRALTCPVPMRHLFPAGDGATLQVHHIAGGDRGPIIVAPGTAMSALSFLTDTTDQSFAEYLAAEGYDVWLFDWRTSPLLDAHTRPYSFDDVARHDWPAVIDFVRTQTGADSVAVLAHCLSAPSMFLSLIRGYVDPAHISAFIPSQVALHPIANLVHRIKVRLGVERFLSGDRVVHQIAGAPRKGIWDFSVGILARVIPKSYRCDNPACHRQSATYGDIIGHDRISDETHELMGDLVPRVHSSFLQAAGPVLRAKSMLTGTDHDHLDRLTVPILLISGEDNQMFVAESTERTYRLLQPLHGDRIERAVFEDFGHLDCWFDPQAQTDIWPRLTEFLSANALPQK